MTESEFLDRAEAALAQIESSIDDAAIEAECSLSALVLAIDFDDGTRMIVNAQTPMRQLWLATRGGGMHFGFDGTSWRDLRSGEEFFDALSRVVSEHLGRKLRLHPR
ncbi:MAG TPA: iron donor protein CyaY [Burkholderiaceae bacterium]|nr:iron donor protein CyaY [Burkholderiaceae bacterium]